MGYYIYIYISASILENIDHTKTELNCLFHAFLINWSGLTIRFAQHIVYISAGKWNPEPLSLTDMYEHSAMDCKTQIEQFMGPAWGLPGSCRPQIGPMLAHEPCYQGSSAGNFIMFRSAVCNLIRITKATWILYFINLRYADVDDWLVCRIWYILVFTWQQK